MQYTGFTTCMLTIAQKANKVWYAEQNSDNTDM